MRVSQVPPKHWYFSNTVHVTKHKIVKFITQVTLQSIRITTARANSYWSHYVDNDLQNRLMSVKEPLSSKVSAEAHTKE
jgi:hypothetical protein